MDMEEPQVESMMYSRQAHEYMKRGRDLPWEVQRVQNWKFRRFFKGQFGNYDSALEIGSGLGDWSNLLPGNLDVTRSDMDSEILDLAREKYPRANYRQIDLSNIDLEDGSVEAVFGNSVLDCVHPLDRVVDELHRVLKPSGKVVHTNYYLPANPNIAKWLNENKDGYFTTVGLGSKIDTRMYIIRFESRERYEQFADQAFAFFQGDIEEDPTEQIPDRTTLTRELQSYFHEMLEQSFSPHFNVSFGRINMWPFSRHYPYMIAEK